VKNEHKESEGDPHHKHQRRALHRQLAAGGPARGVRAATAVVVNPTHIAVAHRYEPKECDAPYLVAKGRESDALALRRAAEQLGIPVVRDIPLARSLVQFDVGMEIPEELYQAAAAVLTAALDAGTAPAQSRPR
jgi:type III secretion protein U